MIDVRARFGYTAATGSTDDARTRHLTPPCRPTTPAAPPGSGGGFHRGPLPSDRHRGLGEVNFRDSGSRALEVELTDLLDLDFEL
ncbi:hypothetical protein ACPB9J_32215 [Streptomyces lavendulocolor]|uniref:hypothetical protein n=1 Tax=Streptomyces lavendulocolor TaxID=67316 RepID=UPI003C2F9409